MGLLRLRLDVDGDVHPELYALLAALPLDASRVERLRQLAAAGLIWEQLRAQSRREAVSGDVDAAAAGMPARPAAVPTASPTAVSTSSPALVPVLRDAVPVAELARWRIALVRRLVEGSAGLRNALVAAGLPTDTSRPLPRPAAAPPADAAASQPAHEPAPEPGAAPAGPVDAQLSEAPRAEGRRARLLRMKQRGLFQNG